MRTVETYERFERHFRAWSERELESLLVAGPPGVGKSTCYERVLGGRNYHRFGGRMTAFECYCQLYDQKHLPVVFDDVSGMLCDRVFVDFMKQLCVPQPLKVITWRTSTRLLKGRKKEFWTPSRALIVVNELPAANADVMAVLDRLDAITFEPTKAEILAKMRQIWPSETELIDLLATLPTKPSLRTMEKALRWQQSKHLDLAEELLAECGVPAAVRQLVCIIPNYSPSSCVFRDPGPFCCVEQV